MPTTYTIPHLSWILGLKPIREPQCVGYDISQGRRCDTETNLRDRNIAQMFLNIATARFRAGRRVDYFLEAIAPRVLCRGDHQFLATLLVAHWERQIAAFEAIDDPIPFPNGYAYGIWHGVRYVYGEYSELGVYSWRWRIYQRIQNTLHELRERIRDTHVWRICPDLSSFALFSRGNDSVVGDDDTQYWNSAYDPTYGYYRPYIEPAYTEPPYVESSYAETPYTEPPHSQSSYVDPPVSAVTCDVHRRPVEGDCSICLCSLLEPAPVYPSPTPWQWDAPDPEPSSDPHNNWYRGWRLWDYIPGSEGIDYVNDNDEGRARQPDSVSWCRAKCGVNFHTSCIDSWLYMARADGATCPVCRRPWVFGL